MKHLTPSSVGHLHDWLMSQLTEDEQTEVLEVMREMLATAPDTKSIGAVAMGEMTAETQCAILEGLFAAD